MKRKFSVTCKTCSIINSFNVPADMLPFLAGGVCWQCKSEIAFPKLVEEDHPRFRGSATKMVADLNANKKPFLTAADIVFLRELKVGL